MIFSVEKANSYHSLDGSWGPATSAVVNAWREQNGGIGRNGAFTSHLWEILLVKGYLDENIAWIDSEPEPSMPQLGVRIPGVEDDFKWKAKVTVTYTRGEGQEDKVQFPAGGKFDEIDGELWKLWKQYAGAPSFGGDVVLKIKVDGFAEQEVKFRIGGRNPQPATARTYIDSDPDAMAGGPLDFSYAIAKHETKDVNGSGSRYNHFLERSFFPIKNGLPKWSQDTSGPGGYGLFQITGTPSDSKVEIPSEQIWSWHKNVDAYFAIVRHPAKSGLISRERDRIRGLGAAQRTAYDANPISSLVIIVDPIGPARANRSFSGTKAINITSYNGWLGTLESRMAFNHNNPAGIGAGKRWQWNPPIKAVVNGRNETYLHRVEAEIE